MVQLNIDLLGYVGTAILGVTLIPQVYKTYSEKKADNISGIYLYLQIIANLIFIAYAYLIHSLPIIICNGLVFCFASSLLIAKYKFRNESFKSIV